MFQLTILAMCDTCTYITLCNPKKFSGVSSVTGHIYRALLPKILRLIFLYYSLCKLCIIFVLCIIIYCTITHKCMSINDMLLILSRGADVWGREILIRPRPSISQSICLSITFPFRIVARRRIAVFTLNFPVMGCAV